MQNLLKNYKTSTTWIEMMLTLCEKKFSNSWNFSSHTATCSFYTLFQFHLIPLTWWVLKWLERLCLVGKDFLHSVCEHVNGFSPVCVLLWVFKWWLAVNAFPHPSSIHLREKVKHKFHILKSYSIYKCFKTSISVFMNYLYGLSCVCVLTCFLRSLKVVKYFPHPVCPQLNVLPLCNRWWARNLQNAGFSLVLLRLEKTSIRTSKR